MNPSVKKRARRLLATPPHHRSEPWSTNYVTAKLLAYSLGLTEDPVSDRDFAHAYDPGRSNTSDFPSEARHVPLALARVLQLLHDGRKDEAEALLGELEEPQPDPVPDEAPQPLDTPPEPPETEDAPLGADAEVVQPDGGDQGPATETPLPSDFPMRDVLAGAGFTTLEATKAAKDSDLLALSGIGGAKLSLIRAAVAEAEG